MLFQHLAKNKAANPHQVRHFFVLYFALATSSVPLSGQVSTQPALVKTGTASVPPVEVSKASATAPPKAGVPPPPAMAGGQKEKAGKVVEEVTKASSKSTAPRIVSSCLLFF